jgi:type II secretory pathway pseudopilin PulG
LGILAAIAVPALTGYIEKSKDKQYEMEARDYVTAARAVIDEAYGKGGFDSSAAQVFLANGETDYTNLNLKRWWLGNLSVRATGSNGTFGAEVGKLMSKTPAASAYDPGGYRQFYFYGPSSPTVGFFESDAWIYFTHPEGYAHTGHNFDFVEPGRSVVEVTYHISPIEADTMAQFNTALNNTATYDESTGYLVYIFTS